MARNENAEHLALVGEIFDGREWRSIGKFRIAHLLFAARHYVEKVRLDAESVFGLLLRLFKSELDIVEKLRTVRLDRRESAGARQVFKNALVHRGRSSEAQAEIKKSRVRSVRLALGDNRLGRHFANALYTA